MQEFVCPDGTMSVNGVCRMFMTPNQREELKVKEEIKPSTTGFDFDFEKIGAMKETADEMISSNLNYYDSFVQDKLGIPPVVQNVARIGATVATGSLMPFAIPFVAGAALKAADNRRVQNITMQDPQGTINTTPARIMNIQPTPRDTYMGGGGGNNSGGFSGHGGYGSSAERGGALHG